MANNTFVGFNLPSSHPSHPGQSTTEAEVVRELQPITTWDRQGNYTVTRRWRGPIDALTNFSQGGTGNKDYDGTYLSGADGIIPGGAGRDGAIKTELQRDEGGQLGIFTATWVTSDLTTALGNPGATSGRTATSGDLYQESSTWTLDGNDIEKSLFECPKMKEILDEIENDTTGTSCSGGQYGFTARLKQSMDSFLKGDDKDGNKIPDYYEKPYRVTDYFDVSACPLVALTSTQLDNLIAITQDYLKGVEAFPISQYVLRNTKTVQYTSSIIPHYANVNEIWTTTDITTLMASETRPIDPPTSTVAYTLPLLGVLGTIFSTSKWLYRTPDVTQLNNGKWQITKEWWETTDYSTSLYDAKT